MTAKLLSGYGQDHSNEESSKQRTEYTFIDLDGIRALVDSPQQVPKAQAQWIIPSSYESRVFKEQEQHGQFWMLWADLDKEPLTIEALSNGLKGLGNFDFEVYSGRSATADNQKARVLIPIVQPLSGTQWQLCQDVLNDKLVQLGAEPDIKNLGCAQLCYLPNRSADFYQSKSRRNGILLNSMLEWSSEIEAKQQAIKAQAEAIIAVRNAAQARRASIGERNHTSLIEAFNHAYDVASILIHAGYEQRGNCFRHPHSESGSYSASVKDGRVHSLSSNDPLYTNGAGGGAHDAFSAFTVLFANGNQAEALKRAGDQWLTIDGESWNTVQQRRYMQSKDEVSADHFPLLEQNNSFSFSHFALNGSSQKLREKMLEDKFILGRIAILGQSTVFYAPPNAGKTLLTIWLLKKAIESGDIQGEDVYYVNADDNYKGLVTKLGIAESCGFNMLAPGHNDFKPDLFAEYVKQMIKDGSVHGKIIILDTVKKFTDIMDKRLSTDFGKTIREFVLQGGSVIMLAHVNKHRSAENKVVFAGTSDLFDDVDCAYTLDVIKRSATGEKTVLFENFKSRGDVAQTASYCYRRVEGQDYLELLSTVRQATKDDVGQAKKAAAVEAALERNKIAIDAILDVMSDGISLKTEIINSAAERSIASKQAIKKALIEHTGKNFLDGHRWSLTIDKADNNAHIYKPLLLVRIPTICDEFEQYEIQSNGG